VEEQSLSRILALGVLLVPQPATAQRSQSIHFGLVEVALGQAADRALTKFAARYSVRVVPAKSAAAAELD
jgi:hypothetical protein